MQAHVGSLQTSIWLAVPVATAQLVGCLTGGALIDRVGRRPLVLVSLVGAAISLAAEGGAFYLDAKVCAAAANGTSDDTSEDTGEAASVLGAAQLDSPFANLCVVKSYITVGAMVLYLLSFGVGMSPVPWAINSEIYPLRVRTVCVGIATAANWVTNFLVAATFLSLQDAVSKPGAFWLYGAFTVMGAIWLCLTMPETAGRSLEQIEVLFERPSRVITRRHHSNTM